MSSTTAAEWSLYPYEPNKAAPIVFAILLTALGCLQLYQSFFKYNWKKFGGTMIWATSVWVAGFVTRSISVHQKQNVGIFIAQYVLVLVGPPLFSAAEYFILSRLLSYLPYHTPIHPGRVFSTFIFLSAVVETLTGSGAGNSVGSGRTASQRKTGLDLLKAALILQCFVEVAFMALVATFQYRVMRSGNFPLPSNVKKVCYILYLTSSMILIRCIVRTVEGFEAARCDPEGTHPYCGPVARNEWFLFVLETANITLFVIILAVFHPGRYLPGSDRIYLDPVDGKTERLGPGFSKADKRPFFVTVVDSFNFYGIVSGKGMVLDKFWERDQPVHGGGYAGREVEEVRVVEV